MRRVALLLGTALLTAVVPRTSAQSTAPRIVHVVAERFVFTPAEITIEQGTVLELRLTSEDTAHGFRVIGPSGPADIDIEIPKRGRGDRRVTFQPAEPGRYTFECSRICGAGHSFMRGTIRVTAPDRKD